MRLTRRELSAVIVARIIAAFIVIRVRYPRQSNIYLWRLRIFYFACNGNKLRFNCVSFQQISVFREEYQHAKIAETALLQNMAMLHVIVQNTSKELVANKVTKIDSLRPLNYVNIFQDFHSKVKIIFLF